MEDNRVKIFGLSSMAALAVLLLAFSTNARAAVYTFSSGAGNGVEGTSKFDSDQTLYSTTYSERRVGILGTSDHRVFLGFDLQSLSLPNPNIEYINQATLSLTISNINSDGLVPLTDFEIDVFEYPDNAGLISTLRPPSTPSNGGVASIWNDTFVDLGAGDLYGGGTFDFGGPGGIPIDGSGTIDIPLSASAINRIVNNSAGLSGLDDIFVVGLRGTLNGPPTNQSVLFSASSTLSISTVPEPGTWLVIGSVIIGVGWISYRRRKAAAEMA
jgi:hypothetical protein